MSDRATIDVVITYYDLAEYVGDAVASALAQPNVDVRVLIVDDHSPVPVPVEVLEQAPDRITVIRRTERGGPGAALNTGMRACTATYVAILDADDLWPAARCRELVAALERGADIAFGSQVLFNDGDTPRLDADAANQMTGQLSDPGLLQGCTMFRGSLLEDAPPFSESLRLGTFITWLDAVRHLKPAPVEVAVHVPVLLRRSHARNITRTRADNYRDYLAAVRQHRARSRSE